MVEKTFFFGKKVTKSYKYQNKVNQVECDTESDKFLHNKYGTICRTIGNYCFDKVGQCFSQVFSG